MNIEYGKLTKLLQKTFINAYIPNDKNAFDELVSYIVEDNNGEYSFELNKLLATKNKELKTYFESLLPKNVLEDTNDRQKIINSYEAPDKIIEYGIPQVCLEDLYDSNFRKKLEEKNSFFKQLHNENSERYYEFNLVPEFLEKASRMWSVEYKQIKNKLVPEKFLWTGYEELTSRNQVVSNNELKSSGRTEVGVFEKSMYFIYETYAQGEYSKLHNGQKYCDNKVSEEIEHFNISLEKYIELAFDIISNKLNEYKYRNDKSDFDKYGSVIRENCKTEKESDIKNYQIDKINDELQRFNNYVPWDLYERFGKKQTLLEQLYDDCRFAPSVYKSHKKDNLFNKDEGEDINNFYKFVYNYITKEFSESQIDELNKKSNGIFVSPQCLNLFEKIEAMNIFEVFITSSEFAKIIQEAKKEDADYYRWKKIEDKWKSNNTGDLNPNGSVRERYIAAGMSNYDVEYIKENSFDTLDDEDFNSMFSDEKSDDESEKDELFEEDSTIDDAEYSEKDIIEEMTPDFDNDSADQDFGMEGIESNITDDSISISCISKVEGKIKELFNNYFSSNLQFRNFMYSWCEYALLNYDKVDKKLSNLKNEYNAIFEAFNKFGDNSDFSKNVDKFLRQVKELVVITDEQITEYKKSFTALRKEFKNWFEKECK